MKIICISGHAQNGKDTTAQILKKIFVESGKSVLIMHFADLLKYMCKSYFNWDGRKDEAGRHLLQYVGTDKVRAVNPNYWVEYVYGVLMLFRDEWEYVLIPDCRFPNEIEYFRDNGCSVKHIRISREGFDNGLTSIQKQHPSETSLDGYKADYTIRNNGSIVDLERSVMDIAKILIGDGDDC